MQVDLAYGVEGLTVEVPDDAVVIVPNELAALPYQAEAVRRALRQPTSGRPLAELAGGAERVAVVFPDLTRPMPNKTVLPPLLAELEAAGVPDSAVTLLCATGTHRAATPAEMEELVGPDIVARYAIVDHDSDEGDAHMTVGRVDGVPVRLQRHYVEADLRIITGFVEPHFFAGFSGGPKAVCPGLAATETILEAHHPRRIAAAEATFVTRTGNPVHDFVRAAVALAPPQLSIDVTINSARQVTAVFAGALTPTHDAACAFAQDSAVQQVPAALRRGGNHQRRPPAGPQPVPGGQGHGGGRAHRARRRPHRDGGGLRGRRAAPRRLRQRAGVVTHARRPGRGRRRG